jgi:hypothetical protein
MKKLFELLTSTKGIIIASVALITIVNELRLQVAVYEIAEQNRVEVVKMHKLDSLRLDKMVDVIKLDAGLVVDYSLIRDNTAQAVKEGFEDAIAYNKMQMNMEKNKYSTFILEKFDGSMTLMLVEERKDTIPKITEYLKIK